MSVTDRLPPADLERLCRALGFEPIWYYAGRWFESEALAEANYKATAECGSVQSLHVERRAPPLDTDPVWAVRAMEAALDRRLWITVKRGKDGISVFADSADWSGAVETAKKFPLALCRALLVGLKGGKLEP